MTETMAILIESRVMRVNVGVPRDVEFNGETRQTAIYKSPAAGRVAALDDHLVGDKQANVVDHGGPDKAVYAYAREDLDFWAAELGRDVEDGFVGENLTTAGLDVSGAVIGERWHIGTAVFEVAQPRIPCWKLGVRTGVPGMERRFGKASRPGAYLRIVTEGEIGAGDAVEVVSRPDHGFTLADAARIYHLERSSAAELLDVPELAPPLKVWAAKRLAAPNA